MTITNGQILLIVLIALVYLIQIIRKRLNSYTRRQLQKIIRLAEENSLTAKRVSDDFFDTMDSLQNLSWQNCDPGDKKLLEKLVHHCEIQMCNADVIAHEWKYIAEYAGIGLQVIGGHKYANPDINLRKKFNQNYRKSIRCAKHLKTARKIEEDFRFQYRNLFLLPYYGIQAAN